MKLILNALLLGMSLSADCFAVSLCSSFLVSREELRKKVWPVAAVFAVIQAGFLAAGWGLGTLATELVADHVAHFERGAHLIGFALLLYVGMEMFIESMASPSFSSSSRQSR